MATEVRSREFIVAGWLRLAIVAGLALLAISGSARADEAFKEFKSETGRFTVQLPGKPEEQKRSSDTPAGLIHVFMFFVRTPEVVYLVGYGDYPEATVKELGPEPILEADRDSFVKATQGKITMEKKVTLDGHPGLEFAVEGPNKTLFLVREYLVQNRVYQVLARTVDLGKPELKKFQDSFKVLKQ